jgi:protocatechuate 3,4-dioxygenase beta subunit
MSNRSDRRGSTIAAIAVTALGLVRPGDALAQRERPPRPAQMAWQATATPAGEPGEPLVVSGTVFGPDGTTPRPGVVVYAYQTDARGLYTPDGRPGVPRLHAWMRTDERGRYEMRTIRPASYPGQTITAHIHMVVSADGREQMTAIEFDDDPLLTPAERRRAGSGPFSSLCRAERDASGGRRCTVDIRVTAP